MANKIIAVTNENLFDVMIMVEKFLENQNVAVYSGSSNMKFLADSFDQKEAASLYYNDIKISVYESTNPNPLTVSAIRLPDFSKKRSILINLNNQECVLFINTCGNIEFNGKSLYIPLFVLNPFENTFVTAKVQLI